MFDETFFNPPTPFFLYYFIFHQLEVACQYAKKCKVTHTLAVRIEEGPKFIQRMASPGAEDEIQMEEGCQFKELWAAVLTTDHCTDEPPHGEKRLHCQYADMCLGKNDKTEGEKSTSSTGSEYVENE